MAELRKKAPRPVFRGCFKASPFVDRMLQFNPVRCRLMLVVLFVLEGLLVASSQGAIDALYPVWNTSQEMRLSYWQAQIQALGRPTSASSIVPEAIADKDNAAIIYRAFEERMEADREFAEQIEGTRSWLREHGFGTDPLDDAFYGELKERLDTPEAQEVIRLAQQMQTYPAFDYGMEFENGIGEASLPSFTAFSSIYLFALFQGYLDLHEGNIDQGYATMLLSLQHPEMFRTEPNLICEMMQLLCYDIVAESLIQAMDDYPPDKETLLHIRDELSKHQYPNRQTFAQALDTERIWGSDYYFKVLTGEAQNEKLVDNWAGSRKYPWIDRFFYTYYWATLTELSYRLTNQLISYEPLTAQFLDEIERLESRINYNSTSPYNTSIGIILEHVNNSDAKFGLLPAVVAVQLYELDHGEYPAKWADMRPNYLPSIPLHPFNLMPAEYKRTGEGYSLVFRKPEG